MIKEFVDRFIESKDLLRASLTEHPKSYKELVEKVFLLFNNVYKYGNPDAKNIYEIDNGDHQGAFLYLVPSDKYHYSRYWFVRVGYGSCGGCDILQAIIGYDDKTITEKQKDSYMTLMLHIVQRIKLLPEDD